MYSANSAITAGHAVRPTDSPSSAQNTTPMIENIHARNTAPGVFTARVRRIRSATQVAIAQVAKPASTTAQRPSTTAIAAGTNAVTAMPAATLTPTRNRMPCTNDGRRPTAR
ncbi:MAG TPA: hypothetical protein VNM90_03385 [Haliangium sp.]|nr:hypothetical protein [Haliangium sp.]